jgi:hypothetical protein
VGPNKNVPTLESRKVPSFLPRPSPISVTNIDCFIGCQGLRPREARRLTWGHGSAWQVRSTHEELLWYRVSPGYLRELNQQHSSPHCSASALSAGAQRGSAATSTPE